MVRNHHPCPTQAWSELPWRQPPDPLPRWMLEREIGEDAAQVVVRTLRKQDPKLILDAANKCRARPSDAAAPSSGPTPRRGATKRVKQRDAPPKPRAAAPPTPTTPPSRDARDATLDSVLGALESVVRHHQNTHHRAQMTPRPL